MKQKYIWAVSLEDKRVEVVAEDKLQATKIAANKLGVLWSRTARDMVALRLRKYESFGGKRL
jgi:hypothetical protein